MNAKLPNIIVFPPVNTHSKESILDELKTIESSGKLYKDLAPELQQFLEILVQYTESPSALFKLINAQTPKQLLQAIDEIHKSA